jgi:hypothetical protein
MVTGTDVSNFFGSNNAIGIGLFHFVGSMTAFGIGGFYFVESTNAKSKEGPVCFGSIWGNGVIEIPF